MRSFPFARPVRTAAPLFFLLALILGSPGSPVDAQQPTQERPAKTFTDVTVLPYTSIKNQASTSTCWCFSAISLLESELLRMGKGEWDLSEMFIVDHVYRDKAGSYYRMQGNNTFAPGGLGHDVFATIAEHGIVREEDFSGMWPYESAHNHAELQNVLRAYMDAVLRSRPGPTPKWQKGYEAILDAYLGPLPERIEIRGRPLTPRQFAASVLGIDPAAYIEITSFSHMPFYTPVELMVPDNWVHNDEVWNLPVDDVMRMLRSAVESGYTVVFGGDMSEREFDQRAGYALWKEGETISQDDRQEMWDRWTTTDDHGMHIVGIAQDEEGNLFYRVKNSWGDTGPYGGHIYMSENYIRAKFDLLTLHSDAIPDDIKTKMKTK
jgi:bleomycin hydrolase